MDKSFDDLITEIMDEIRREDLASKTHLESLQRLTNEERMAQINSRLPVRVRVGADPSDAEWESGTCDRGRIGWVRKPVTIENGYFHAYVEDLSPGDDGDDNCPTRYHQPRHLHIVKEEK